MLDNAQQLRFCKARRAVIAGEFRNLNPQQRQAVEMAASRQVMLLTGGPGTGKTTCLRGVLALFEALMCFGATMFGDAVRDLLDPRLKGGVGSYSTKKLAKVVAKMKKEYHHEDIPA